jgi:hypothetical protein
MAQNNQAQKSIVETTASIEPVAVVYNIQSDDIQDYIYNYLTNVRQVDGVAAVRVSVVRDGNRNPELAIYAFFNQDSKDVFTAVRNIPQHLRAKMDMGGFKASDKLKKALNPVIKDLKLSGDPRNRLVYVKLDVFKVLGLMLAADPRRHWMQVTEVVKLKKKGSVTTVIKQNKFVSDRSDDYDKYSAIVERNEH